MTTETEHADSRTRAERHVAGRRIIRRWVAPYALVIFLVILTAVFSITNPSTFATAGNVNAIVSSQTLLLLLSLAVLFPLRGGDFDLTISSTMLMSGAVVAILTTQHHFNGVVAMLLGVCVGAVVGIVNSAFIVGLGLDAFITTLGIMTALTGLTYAITGSVVITGLPADVLSFSRADWLGLQSSTWYAWILALIVLYIFEFTPYGRYLLFVGGNRDAARLSNVRVKTIRASAFITSGIIAGLAGVVLAGTLGSVDPSSGGEFLLQPFAACFLGMTAITVGRFNVLGTVIALYLLAVGITGLELIGAQPWVADVFNGGALVLAITFAWFTGRLGSIGRGRLRSRASSSESAAQ
jgi:ribose transport system permease protein